MRSPAAAIAWEFRRRHRWGLLGLTGYVVFLAVLRLTVMRRSVTIDDELTFALVVMVPLTFTFLYLMAVFTYGLAGDIAARESMYPKRMFTLPVTTTSLAGLPMLYGTSAMAILWAATRLLGVWPSNHDVPTVWPALLGASLLAWTQALTWMPYALRGMRVIVTIFWLVCIDAIVMIALEYKAREWVMLVILAPHVPLAFLAARYAVGRARRGDIPDWGGVFGSRRAVTRRADFPSAERAQMWFEWRRHGRSLPILVAILLPFELSMLFLFRNTPEIVIEMLVLVLTTPPFMAAFVAATVSKSDAAGSDAYSLSPFSATRPMTSASLIAAKLKVTILSSIAAWILVLVAAPMALRWSGTMPIATERIHALIDVTGKPRAIAIVLLIFAFAFASTWRQLVQGLFIGLSGRPWVIKANVFSALVFLSVLFPLLHWATHDRRVMGTLWYGFPWIAGVLIALKMSIAAWVAVRLYQTRVISDRLLVAGAACWTLSVFALYALMVWIAPELMIRSYVLALVAILAVPLARVSAAPLALAWNRHR